MKSSLKILFDSNVLISAMFSKNSTPARAIDLAIELGAFTICEQNFEKVSRFIRENSNRKFANASRVLRLILTMAKNIPTPTDEIDQELLIRDETDRPILRAAVSANVDIIISGDKDFLEAGIDKPKILTARDFIDQFTDENN